MPNLRSLFSRALGRGGRFKDSTLTPSGVAFDEIITNESLYPAEQDDPLRHLELHSEVYGDLRPDQYYSAFGYLHAPGLVPSDVIDELAREYRGFVRSYAKPLLRQSGQYEAHQLDAGGAVHNALLNPHLAHKHDAALKNLSDRVLAVACNRRLQSALALLTPYPRHRMVQTMLFEQSVTPAHQDWTYLDTLPAGHLTAAWIALEDIEPDAARFFVVPGSQNFRHFFAEEDVRTASYQSTMTTIYRERFESRQVVPRMKKGDVVFWNSRLLHGSIPGTNPLRTRLSLAVHTLPLGFGFGNVYREIPVDTSGVHQSMPYV